MLASHVRWNEARESWLRRSLRQAHPVVFTLYAALSAFSLYTCVYAFRKSFAAATFDDLLFVGISFKVWLVSAQVVGYALSKFIGIKIISEIQPSARKNAILLIAVIAGLSWFGFAITPVPVNILFLFINGLTLGLVWGLVFGYLEGRTVTEVLGAALSVSFIFSSGLCRSVGAFVINHWNVSETWMPWIVSCLFFAPLVFFLILLDSIPPPNARDVESRTQRKPMLKADRKRFIATFLPGIVLFVLAYMLLTTFRDFRDNFSAEIWKELGADNNAAIYTQTEIPISIIVLFAMAMLMLIKNNKLALMINHVVILAGMLLIGISTFAFERGLIDSVMWMVLIGLGLYLGYVPFNSIFFDRMLAAFKFVGTVGFIMYIADAFGYLGSVSVLFVKEFVSVKVSWLQFFTKSGYVVSVIGALLTIGSMIYFSSKRDQNAEARTA